MDRAYWNQDREKLFEWITTNGSASFADLYKGAVFNLFERTPGHVRFVAHAARDLMNGMPAHKLGRKRQRVQYSQLVSGLKRACDDAGLKRLDTPTIVATPLPESPSAPSEVSIPAKVMEKVWVLLEEHDTGSKRQNQSPYLFFEAYVTGSDDMRHAADAFAETWLTLQRWFQESAHEGGSPPSAERLSNLQSKFEQLESIILAVADRYRNTIERIDEILDQANN